MPLDDKKRCPNCGQFKLVSVEVLTLVIGGILTAFGFFLAFVFFPLGFLSLVGMALMIAGVVGIVTGTKQKVFCMNCNYQGEGA